MNKKTVAIILYEVNGVFHGATSAHLRIDDHLACDAETGLALTLNDFIELMEDDYDGELAGMACPKCIEYCNAALLKRLDI